MGSVGKSPSENSYDTQTFKLTRSAFGVTKYESELFTITKYNRNPKGTSWTESGYAIRMKDKSTKEPYHASTLKEAKEFINSDAGKEWYKEQLALYNKNR